MTTKKARPESVTEYINAAPKEAREKLREIRACIRGHGFAAGFEARALPRRTLPLFRCWAPGFALEVHLKGQSPNHQGHSPGFKLD